MVHNKQIWHERQTLLANPIPMNFVSSLSFILARFLCLFFVCASKAERSKMTKLLMIFFSFFFFCHFHKILNCYQLHNWTETSSQLTENWELFPLTAHIAFYFINAFRFSFFFSSQSGNWMTNMKSFFKWYFRVLIFELLAVCVWNWPYNDIYMMNLSQ